MVANVHTHLTALSQGTFLSVSAAAFAEAAAFAGVGDLDIWRHAPGFESASAVGVARRADLSVDAVSRASRRARPAGGGWR
ncbi:hypothetical protein GCM10011608_42550 [Micromonospora sonchi]|uniref:Uncharacterized protein n=1 Tax=Micromonospora sonchi TaxID=1763543 RepID=A0A917X0A0_9ACTN|nr:hypothetical protein [Micromonospora sonchi]GGM53170.1 hypothetical protein GCM10011608_42550 [Micromonospora sonchi]